MIRFVTWRNCGLGLMILPEIGQAGIIFLFWSIVFIWKTTMQEVEENNLAIEAENEAEWDEFYKWRDSRRESK